MHDSITLIVGVYKDILNSLKYSEPLNHSPTKYTM